MSTISFRQAPKTKQKTTKGQWITIGIIIVVFVVIWIILWFTIVDKLFGGSDTGGGPSGPTPGCTPSFPPTNLVASQPNLSSPSVKLEWTAVLNPGTSGETILGYNVYSSESSGITSANTSSVRTSTFVINLTSTSSGDMTSGTTIYFRVSTADTCGESDLSEEISFTPT